MTNFKMGLDWNTKGTATFNDLLAHLTGAKPVVKPTPGGCAPPPPGGLPPPPVFNLPPA